MALSITNELNPTPPKTGGDSYFEPAVMGGRWSSVSRRDKWLEPDLAAIRESIARTKLACGVGMAAKRSGHSATVGREVVESA